MSEYALLNFNDILLGLDFYEYSVQVIESDNIELNCEIRKNDIKMPNSISFI